MGMTWSWLPVPGVIAGSLTLLLAALVFRAEPRGRGRPLTLFLFLWGSQTVLNVLPWFWIEEAPGVAHALGSTFWVTLAAALAAYLWFVSTLDSPFARPIRGRAAIAYWVVVGSALLFMVLDEQYFVRRGPGTRYLSLLSGVAILYGLLVAAGALFRAKRPSARAQARSYLVAAAGHDLLLVPMAIWFGLGSPGVTERTVTLIVSIVPPVAALWLAALLAYGLLRFHIFEIDLKIKWTIRRSTVAGVFITMFFIVSESVATFLGDRWGTYSGIAAAGLLLFAITPLQQLADQVTNAAMPHVRDTADYRETRRLELYRAALEGAAVDGVITSRERDILARLQDRLGLSASEALALEREVTQPTADSG